MKNLELKAVTIDLARLRRVLRVLGAEKESRPLDQEDSYFAVPRGRLKLRQRRGRRDAELIFYARPDAARARTSEYQKLAVADPPGMLRLLQSMFAPGPCVRKRRELWWLHGTRVHLDRVTGLGTFVEIEVPYTRDAASARRTMRMLTGRLGIAAGDVLSCSYADLLTQRSRRRTAPVGRARPGAAARTEP